MLDGCPNCKEKNGDCGEINEVKIEGYDHYDQDGDYVIPVKCAVCGWEGREIYNWYCFGDGFYAGEKQT